MQSRRNTGVGGTVDAFNFIKRFSFPATPHVLAYFAIISLVSTFLSLVPTGEGPVGTFVFAGAVLIVPGVVGGLLSAPVLLRRDKILDFRRIMGLEIVALLPLAIIFPLFSVIGVVTGLRQLWMDGFLAGFAVSLPMRFLTLLAMSTAEPWRKVCAALATPLFTMIAFLALTPLILPVASLASIIPRVYVLTSLGLVVSAVGAYMIIQNVEVEGAPEIRLSPMGLFRDFLDHWLRSRPALLEERLLGISTEGSIETRILSFSGKDSSAKSTVVVSNFHPGPYRDMGSGGLPSELKKSVEESTRGVAQVPHGISNHHLNIVSHRDIGKLLEAVKANYPSQHPVGTATKMIREQVGEAIVSGQAFGKIALLTITLSPEEMEDLPTEVSVEIDREASRLGLKTLTVDAHNSIMTQTSITTAQAERIITAARMVLQRLDSLPQEPFKVGAAENSLRPYTLKDGIGPGGLSVMTVKTLNQVVAYITVDGNNMQQGLRERILYALRNVGVDDGEIMTTDTHLVTGLVRSPLGYYPVGEHLLANQFIQTVSDTVRKAIDSMEDSATGHSQFSLQLQVLGSDTFHAITGFIGRIARNIARSFYRLEILSFVLALIILFV